MAASNAAGRWLGLLVFLACVAFSAFGLWYLNGGRFGEEADDVAENDEEVTPEGIGYRRGSKKKVTKPKGKPSEGRQARAGAAHQAERPPPSGPGPSGPSYESAIAGNNLNLAPGMKDAPDLTDAELSGPMRDGTFLDACGVPTSTQVTVKIAIRNGHAVGISVYPVPPSPPIAGCIERHVRGLQWPSNAKMDSFITTY